MSKRKEWDHEVNIIVEGKKEAALMNDFFKNNVLSKRDSFMTVDYYTSYPVVVYTSSVVIGYDGWEWDQSHNATVTGEEISVSKFLEEYDNTVEYNSKEKPVSVEFKVGDIVVLREDSKYYADSIKYPSHQLSTEGVVEGSCNGNITVEWEVDGEECNNSYREGDLALVEKDTQKLKVAPPPTKEEKNTWTSTHYDNNYTLTEEDIEQGFVRMDVYQVNKLWKLNSADDTGAAFHTLKCLGRLAKNKNTKERELRAMYGQIKRWAEIEGIDLNNI